MHLGPSPRGVELLIVSSLPFCLSVSQVAAHAHGIWCLPRHGLSGIALSSGHTIILSLRMSASLDSAAQQILA